MPQFTAKVDRAKILSLNEFLQGKGFEIGDGQHLIFSASKSDCKVYLYETLKLLIQGSKASYYVELLASSSLIQGRPQEYQRETNKTTSLTNLSLPRIGSDESGKGDYFGPLVIGAVYVDERSQATLERIGIRDSKLLSDDAVARMAPQIRRAAVAIHVAIGPLRYNELHKEMKNVNRLLGWGHARAIENILSTHDSPWAVADQFGDRRFIELALFEKGKKIRLIQMPKAESDIAVAAASIVARQEFLSSLNRLGGSLGISLPKGASEAVIEVATEIAKRHGLNTLSTVAKLHFKTTDRVRQALGVNDG